MKISLPTQTQELLTNNNGVMTIKKNAKEQVFDLDMSIASQVRFETKFPELSKNEDLFGYSKRICEIDSLNAGVIVSKLKMLYCWFDTEMEFITFLKMFDLSDIEFSNMLTEKIHKIFETIFNGSAEKN